MVTSIRDTRPLTIYRDPWEEERVYVSQSRLPQGGEGLFAKRDIRQREIIALYNGIKVGIRQMHLGIGRNKNNLFLTNRDACRMVHITQLNMVRLIIVYMWSVGELLC